MPVVGEFHGFYWADQSTVVPPALSAGGGGYPLWQVNAVTVHSLPLGPLSAWWDGLWLKVVWIRTWYRRLRALDVERTAVLERTLTALESPAYVHAQKAVRQTAQTLGFSRPEAWKDLSREVKADPGRTENMYRHQKAMHLFRDLDPSTHTNPEQNLIVELAYQGFSVMGK